MNVVRWLLAEVIDPLSLELTGFVVASYEA